MATPKNMSNDMKIYPINYIVIVYIYSKIWRHDVVFINSVFCVIFFNLVYLLQAKKISGQTQNALGVCRGAWPKVRAVKRGAAHPELLVEALILFLMISKLFKTPTP